ncbi:MAG TPA: TCR/Tet family MFS transporter [Steroidobacteraceae bacterium]|nr:TCR/Tet family MFS transporter [Steroidobacteraceae bacterium]
MATPLVRARPAAVAFILVTVVLDVLAFGAVLPVLPNLIKGFQAGDYGLAALTYGVFATAWSLMQFVFSPLLGVLSDRFGRRRVLLISLTGLGLDYLLMALAPNLAWLFVGRVISGITAASYSTASAYIADVTPPDKRAASFGYIGAAWGIGFVVGPALGGILGHYNLRAPFWVAAGLTLANALYGWFVLPESLPPERRAPFSWRRANPLGALVLIRGRHGLAGLFSMQVLRLLAHYSLPSVFVLYASYRYGWSPDDVGYTLAFVGICTAIVQAGVIGPYVRRFGERGAALTGLVCETIAYALYAFAPTGMVFLCAVPFGALGGLYYAAAQALLTQRVAVHEQGELQGVNSSLMGLVGVIGPGIFSAAFAAGIAPRLAQASLPGAPFYVAAFLTSAAFLIGLKVARPVARA